MNIKEKFQKLYEESPFDTDGLWTSFDMHDGRQLTCQQILDTQSDEVIEEAHDVLQHCIDLSTGKTKAEHVY